MLESSVCRPKNSNPEFAGCRTARREKAVADFLKPFENAASRAGVVVVTANAADFALIERHTPVRWMLPEPPI
jgi:hypothetical protein